MSMEMEMLESVDSRRSEEHAVFSRVTRELEEVARTSQPRGDVVADALENNRQLWAFLQDNLFHEDNMLPEALKEQLIGLASWVDGYTAKILDTGAAIDPLISVNHTIMEGLA